MSEITLNQLLLNMDLIESCVVASPKKLYDRFEFLSSTEGFGSASLIVLPREQATNDLDAFITLNNIYLHYFEGWNFSEITLDYARGVIEHHLLPKLKMYQFEYLSPEEIFNQVILAGIEGFLQHASFGRENNNEPALVEAYLNGNRIHENFTPKGLDINHTGQGIGLSLNWNHQEIFYCTERYFGFFSLHISA